MREVEAFEAQNTFGPLLDLVERGEEIMITRHGKPTARIIRATVQTDPRPALDALCRIRGRVKAAAGKRFDWEDWKPFRDEGRQ